MGISHGPVMIELSPIKFFEEQTQISVKSVWSSGEAQADLLPPFSHEDFIKASQICCVSKIAVFYMEVSMCPCFYKLLLSF